ncbi:MAG: MASE1 domain-containing protein [Gammaproteobacteria bacterium]|nr:MASE1 domain-containing protein [Gammaproteobacteria bacterium]
MNPLLLYLGFVGLYVALDAASFIHPLHGLNITPWNPAPGLGLVLLLRRGSAAWLPLVGTVVLSEGIVRGISQSWWASLVSALVLAGGYITLGELLRRRLSPSTLLDDRTSLLNWIVLVAVGALLISIVYLSSLHVVGLLPADGWQAAVLRFWVGDSVGIAVAMPLFWWLSSDRGRILLISAIARWETLGYTLLSLAALWITFDVGGDSGFKLFYLLFLPIVWASARHGMAGAIISASLLQVEVVVTVQALNYGAVPLAELQILSLAMALIGFFIGSVVDEQRRTGDELKQSLRLAAAGEMAGALAHELNQPLTALVAYASACEILLERGESGDRLNVAIRGMLAESGRAGEIVRRLRDFFRTGATELKSVSLPSVLEKSVQYHREQASKQDIKFDVGAIPTVMLLADGLQLEVVLRNLLANAFDAVANADRTHRAVSIRAEILPGARISIVVEDSGSGLSGKEVALLFEPFQSSKTSGLGLGLVISRAIIDTHGGTLWGEVADHGVFKIILPIQGSSHYE